jgi:SAM-dependent methyltransferase
VETGNALAGTAEEASAAARLPQSLIPPDDLMRIVGSDSAESYLSTGRRFLPLFRRYGGLQPSHRVLDVGCGCGRIARPLIDYLKSGSYDGFDIVPELVAWCRENITPRHPNFRFIQADVSNAFYYKAGATRATQFRFPYDDGTFDFTILASVFTHMLMGDFTRYTDEVARTLKPGGTALMTFFLLNEESLRLQRTPRSQFQFLHPLSHGIRIKNMASPEGAVAYPESLVRSILRAKGLEVQHILFGFWCGREKAISGQDVIVVRKMSQGPDAPLTAGERLMPILVRLKRWVARRF